MKEKNPQYQQFPDDALQNIAQAVTVEITPLVCPTISNGYTGVSMYTDDKSRIRGTSVLNAAATRIARECGHGGVEIYGDAFVGRYVDNEREDVWVRVDFGIGDVEDGGWRRRACEPGGGGGGGGGEDGKQGQIMADAAGGGNVLDLGDATVAKGKRSEDKETDSLTWNQTSDEVEIIYKGVPPSCRSSDVDVVFAREYLEVRVRGGRDYGRRKLGGMVVKDECTWTIQDGGKGGRELCVTLAKREEGEMWGECVREN